MASRNKAINGLRHCTTGLGCYGCPYAEDGKPTTHCQLDCGRDALNVLKDSVIKKKVKKLIRSGLSIDTKADQKYVCELIDGL